MSEEAAVAEASAAPVETAAPVAAPAPTGPLDSFQDADLRTYAADKGFDKSGFEGAVKSYKHMEGLVRGGRTGDLVELPGLDASPEQVTEFYSKLGRPESADGYELPVPEGQDSSMADWAKGIFHEANLTPKQASLIAEKWNEHVGSMVQGQQESSQESAQQAEQSLRKEWGAAYEDKVKGVEYAAQKLGMTDDQLIALNKTMGGAEAMKFVDGLASKMGEDPVELAKDAEVNNTPGVAKDKLNQLMADQDFVKAWMDKGHPQHKWAMEQKAKLAKQMAGVRG